METVYFNSTGKENTDEALKIANEYSDKNDIKSIIVASTTGYTAEKAAEVFKGKNLVVVTHSAGFAEADKHQFSEELRKGLEAKGAKVLTTAHVFGGLNKLSADSMGGIIANTLRMMCEGMKVAVEIAAMAADAGMVSTREDAVVVAGTGKGADTVIVLQPANSTKLFETNIKKILAKPIK